LKEPAETFEARLGFRPICKNWKKSAQEIMARLEQVFAQKIGFRLAQSYEGVRINFADGWMLIRQSVHDPILPINIESDRQGGVFFAVKKLYSVLKKRKELDLNPLKTYILEQ